MFGVGIGVFLFHRWLMVIIKLHVAPIHQGDRKHSLARKGDGEVGLDRTHKFTEI